MPHHVGMQRPLVAPRRFAQVSPLLESHTLDSVHSFCEVNESMPWYRETAFSTWEPPNAFSYFSDGESLLAPFHW